MELKQSAGDTSPEIPELVEPNVNDSEQDDYGGYAEAAYESINLVLDRIDGIEAKFSTLITVLGNNVGLQTGSQEDLDDMIVIIQGQNNIIEALVSHDGLSEESRENLGVVLSEIEDFADIQEARKRIAERRKQREALSVKGAE